MNVVAMAPPLLAAVLLGGIAGVDVVPARSRSASPTSLDGRSDDREKRGDVVVELYAPKECPSERAFEALLRENGRIGGPAARIRAFVVPDRASDGERFSGIFVIEEPSGRAVVRSIDGQRSCETLLEAMALSCAMALDAPPAAPVTARAAAPSAPLPLPRPPAHAILAGAMLAPGMLPHAAPTLVASVRYAGTDRRQWLLFEGTGQWTPSAWTGATRVAVGGAMCGAAPGLTVTGALCTGGEVGHDRSRGFHAAIIAGARIGYAPNGPLVLELRPEFALFPGGAGRRLPGDADAGGGRPFQGSAFTFRVAALAGVRF